MQLVRHLFQNAVLAITRASAGLFGQKSQGIGFAHQAQLAFRFALVGRIHIDAATQECAVEIGYKRAHITGRIGLAVRTVGIVEMLDGLACRPSFTE